LAFHVTNLCGSSLGFPSSPPAPAAAGASPESVVAVGLFLAGEPSLGTGWKKRFIASGRRRGWRLLYPQVRNWTESSAVNVTLIFLFGATRARWKVFHVTLHSATLKIRGMFLKLLIVGVVFFFDFF